MLCYYLSIYLSISQSLSPLDNLKICKFNFSRRVYLKYSNTELEHCTFFPPFPSKQITSSPSLSISHLTSLSMALIALPRALSAAKSFGISHCSIFLSERQIHGRVSGYSTRRCRSPPVRRGVRAMSVSAVTQSQSRDSKSASPALTFQQAIQRLQV